MTPQGTFENNRELLNFLMTGGKITKITWEKGSYIYMSNTGNILDERDVRTFIEFGSEKSEASEFKPFKPEIKLVEVLIKAVSMARNPTPMNYHYIRWYPENEVPANAKKTGRELMVEGD